MERAIFRAFVEIREEKNLSKLFSPIFSSTKADCHSMTYWINSMWDEWSFNME